MNIDNDLKKSLDDITAEKRILQNQLEDLKKKQQKLYDFINKSAIFDESIVFLIAQLISFKEKEVYTPFKYKKYKFALKEYIEDIYIGIAPEKKVSELMKKEKVLRYIDPFFQEKLGYEIFQKDTNIVYNRSNNDNVTYYQEIENDRKEIAFNFLLNDYKISNSYPVATSLYNFEDYEYVQEFIRNLFNLQIQNNGKHLTYEEMFTVMNKFLEPEKCNKKVID